jgi:peptide/nickel transport system substrate-binding protein
VLAGAWQYAPDGTWLRVRIRDNARFSDGQPVTADDVLWTFEWMRNPQVQAERSRSVTDFITSLTKVDDRTVEFTFGQVLFTNLSAAMGTFPILPKHFYEKFTPTQFNQATGLVMGSGPFKLERLDPEDQWTPGTDVVLVRNEMYWGPRPAFDRLRFRVVRDDLARITSFNNGEGDITTPSAPQFARLAQDSAWKSRNTPHMWYNIRGGYNFIGWNCGLRNGKPTVFADKRVRRAMTHLLDRELIARQLFENLARPSSGPFNSETAQSNPEIRPWPFNMDEARRLLAEAGWQDRDRNGVLENAEGREFSFEFTYAVGSEVTEKLAKYLKDQCALVGIRVSLRGMDWSVFMKAMDDRDFDALTLGWSPASPESDPQQIWHSRFIENQGDNFVQWKNPEADRLIEEGRRELDQTKRMEYWHRLHAIIHEEQPYTFLVERPWLRVVNNRVGNFVEYRNGFQYDELFVRSGGGAARTAP